MKVSHALFAALLFALVGMGTFMLTRPPADLSDESPAPTPAPIVQDKPARDFVAGRVPIGEGVMDPDAPTRAPKMTFDQGMLTWEQQIVTLLQDPNITDKGARLVAMLSMLPEEALGTAAELAMDYTTDVDYPTVAMPLLLDVRTHGAIEAVMFKDLMEDRPESITLPVLLAIARTPEHPYAEYAHSNLELRLGEDLAGDWLAWDGAIRQRLAAQR